jgi:hypothetical protein
MFLLNGGKLSEEKEVRKKMRKVTEDLMDLDKKREVYHGI